MDNFEVNSVEDFEPVEELQTESTTEPVRKLASVRRIAAIDPIEGADRIVCATIDGWKVVTQKSNNFKPGDLVVYFEIDSFLPVEEKYEFLRPSSFKSTKHLGDGFRIKTIKLKGQVSQGLILPLSVFFDQDEETGDYLWLALAEKAVDDVVVSSEGTLTLNLNNCFEPVYEGLDLTEYLGVKKYEKPLDPRLAGVARGNFPSFIRKTDQERVQNLFGKIIKHKWDQLDRWEATLKLDGSSMTAYVTGHGTEEGPRFGVCSRNLDLKETEDNTFWQVARKLRLEELLMGLGRNLALQGELMGPGVQGNRENLPEHEFYLFDIWDIDEQRYLTPTERLLICAEELQSVKSTPAIGVVSMSNFKSVDDFLAYADRASINHKVAEGVVFKAFKQDDPSRQINSFKVINQKFLLAEVDDD